MTAALKSISRTTRRTSPSQASPSQPEARVRTAKASETITRATVVGSLKNRRFRYEVSAAKLSSIATT